MARRAKITVPGSSANLGAGFDCLGLACNLTLRLEYELCDEDIGGPIVVLDRDGREPLSGRVPTDRSNLILKTMADASSRVEDQFGRLRLFIDSDIPLTRGLGSSASAIVGALAAADLVSGRDPDIEYIFQRASEIEGHPDNVGASVYGGLIVSAGPPPTNLLGASRAGKDFVGVSLPWPENWRVLAVVPDYEVETSEARAVLPPSYSRPQAVANLQRSALLVAALQRQDARLFAKSLHDELHEPFRLGLVPEMQSLASLVADLPALGMVLSGAGPTMLVFSEARHISTVSSSLRSWSDGRSSCVRVLELEPDCQGIRFERIS